MFYKDGAAMNNFFPFFKYHVEKSQMSTLNKTSIYFAWCRDFTLRWKMSQHWLNAGLFCGAQRAVGRLQKQKQEVELLKNIKAVHLIYGK